MKVLTVVGNRPQFIKAAAVSPSLRTRQEELLVHTGQHFDDELSAIFFAELGLPAPDRELGIALGTNTSQTARMLAVLETTMAELQPDVLLVYGDTNSTLAGALAGAQAGIPVAHVEAGMRSFDRTMPEELNRIVTDQLSDHLFIHSPEANDNLHAEGIPAERIHMVGNTMIDTLVALEDRFRSTGTATRLGVEPGDFVLVTLHRPALVDGPLLAETIEHLATLAREIPVVFPIHPRTRAMMDAVASEHPGLRLFDPLGYIDFLSLLADASAVLTDSGGIQEETTYLGIPCFTLRDNTERPITISAGTNTLLGLDAAAIAQIPIALAQGPPEPLAPPPLWDGHASERIADVVAGKGLSR
jgi:UDP-N-acetylglucosamine 2-epimerase (non-hydrolysing)